MDAFSEPQLVDELVTYLVRSRNPQLVSTIERHLKSKFEALDDNEVRLALWKLSGAGVAEFDRTWRVSIPEKNRSHAQAYARRLPA